MAASGRDHEPRYTVAAVARRLGVAPATLRTWDRRYGLGPTEHEAGTQRRYSHSDVQRLDRMRRLTLDGVAPREAALLAAETQPPAVLPPRAPPATGAVREAAAEAPPVPRAAAVREGSGGRVMAVPGASPAVRGLARAAMTLDANAVTEIIERSLAATHTLATWDDLLCPVLVAIGRRWAATGDGVDVEHLLSECIAGALWRTATAAPHALAGRPVLLSGSPEDQHSLPLYAIAAALAERGVPTRVLGASVPPDALRSAVTRTAPPALFVWAQLQSTTDRAAVDALPVTRPATRVVVGGPGWPQGNMPSRATYAASLGQAVDLLRGQAL